LNLTITGKHIKVTEALKKYARDKTSKLPKYYDSVNQIQVVIDGNEHHNINVEIIVRAEHNKVFVANEISNDAYKGIDSAIHKLERQLRRKNKKERNNKHSD